MNRIKLHLFVWMFAWFFVLKKKKGKKRTILLSIPSTENSSCLTSYQLPKHRLSSSKWQTILLVSKCCYCCVVDNMIFKKTTQL